VPARAHVTSNVTSIEKRGRGSECPAGVGRRRRHRGEAVESKERDATLDVLLKHPDAILATYV
jgi:hypothetical protein